MFFQKKLDRSYDTLKFLGAKKGEASEEELKDILAMIIAAFIVFGPLFLIIGLAMFFITL